LFFYFDEQKEALSLVTGAELSYENREFVGKDCSFLRYIPSEKEGFDHLVLTEEKEVVLNAPFFSSFAKKRHRTRSYDLSLKELWQDPTEKGILKMVKRLSQTLLPITFGFLGIAFGLIAPKRKTPKAPYLVFALLILFYFACHFLAKKLPLPLASAALLPFTASTAFILLLYTSFSIPKRGLLIVCFTFAYSLIASLSIFSSFSSLSLLVFSLWRP
jgi:lipopolysaccharide export LptBFGC system permease protein LptF